MSAERQWIPLESNPDVLTRFAHALGVSPSLAFSDVFSLDLLEMVPAPRHAVMLLFPLTPALSGTTPPTPGPTEGASAPYFVKQTIANACGTIALLHAALNASPAAPPLQPDSFFARFLADTAPLDPAARARALHDRQDLDEVHGKFAAEGQTAAPPADAKVDLHFVCFVEKAGTLYELDGRKDAPVDHGPCPQGLLLETAANAIREQFMKKDPAETRFSILALTAAE